MGVPKKRTSKMRRDKRRSANNKLKSAVQLNACANCGATAGNGHFETCFRIGEIRGHDTNFGNAGTRHLFKYGDTTLISAGANKCRVP